jgi:Zn-dependent M16 (insulinase) family peptidase
VFIGFHGPKATCDFETLTACYIFMKYLCETSVSPIQQRFIEIDDPFASDVRYHITENSTSLLYFTFENVPLDKLDFIYERLIQLLVDIANNPNQLDERRLQVVFEKYILERLSSLENSPHDGIAFHILGDFLYGTTSEDFYKRLNITDVINHLQKNPLDYWINLLRKYFIDNHSVTIRAVPSVAEKVRLAKEEAERLERRRLDLGEAGLARKGQELVQAMAENDREPPMKMLTSIPVPSTKSIVFHELDIVKCEGQYPFYLELYDIKSNFVYVTACFDTSEIPSELRSYLTLFLDLILESPVTTEEGLLPYESVVAALEEEIISYETSLGLQSTTRFGCGPFSNSASFHMQVEVKKLSSAVGWMTKLIFDSVFTHERIHIVATKFINDIAAAKREGYDLARELSKALYFKSDTNVNLNSLMKQSTFLTELVKNLKVENNIVGDLKRLRDLLLPTMTVHVAANIKKIPDLKESLAIVSKKLVKLDIKSIDYLPVTLDSKLINKDGNLDPLYDGTVVGIGCIESGYVFHTSPGIVAFDDPDLSAVLLYLQYLSQLEGPMWKKIRKNSYGYNIVPRPNEGLLMFTLYKATNIYEAFRDAKAIVEDQLRSDANFDATLMESARSSLIFEIIEREKTVGHLEQQALLNSFKGVSKDYNKGLVDQIANVSVEDLRRIGSKYIASIFKPRVSKTVVVCHPEKVESITAQFKEFDLNLMKSLSLETSILNTCSLALKAL